VKGTIMRDDEAYEQCDEKPWMLFIDTPDDLESAIRRNVAQAGGWAS